MVISLSPSASVLTSSPIVNGGFDKWGLLLMSPSQRSPNYFISITFKMIWLHLGFSLAWSFKRLANKPVVESNSKTVAAKGKWYILQEYAMNWDRDS